MIRSEFIPFSIACCSNVHKTVSDLRKTGSTALGPALTVCAALVSEVPYSEVVLCTDGMANVGIGSIRAADSDAFYDKVYGSKCYSNKPMP